MHHGPFGENLYAERSWVSRLLPAGFGLEFGQPPGGARVGIGGWVRAGWEGDSDVIGRGRVLAEVGDSGADPGELVGVFQVDRELVLPRPLPAGCDGTMAGKPMITLPLLRLGRLQLDPALRVLQPGSAASGLVVTATVAVPDTPRSAPPSTRSPPRPSALSGIWLPRALGGRALPRFAASRPSRISWPGSRSLSCWWR